MAEKFYTDLDVIVGGHSHTPLQKPVIQNGVIIVQAGSLGRYLGKLDLQIDTEKDTVTFYSGELIETIFDSSIADADAQKEVDHMMETIQSELNEVIGILETPWEREYGFESNLGQWEADAIRERIGSDIAFMNSGGLRSDLEDGNITVNDIWTINPFGNTIVTMTVTGKVLNEMMENTLHKNYIEIKEEGRTDLVITSGLQIKYDRDKMINDGRGFITQLNVKGEPVIASREYIIATNNYVGEQFNKFFGETMVKPEITYTNILDRDLFISAVKEQKVINSIRENRVVDISK
jgi:2',3'-cyclic-nucleotide 2'-phosphodiesterase (5'-nucleotidase family)